MNCADKIAREWGEVDGFFYLARKMKFDEFAAARLMQTLRDIDIRSCSSAEMKEILERIWNLPFFALVYRERCIEMGADEENYDRFRLNLSNIVDENMRKLIEKL